MEFGLQFFPCVGPKETFDSQLAKNVAWIGTPDMITKQIATLCKEA